MPLGLKELRECLSERLRKKGIDTSPKEILICSGSLQGLQLISASMVKKGDTIFTEAPSYLKSLQIFQSSGANFIGVEMDREGMMPWTIIKPSQNAFIYTIPTFQNPTGKVMTAKRRKELYNFCSTNRLPLIEDDAYAKLWFYDEYLIWLRKELKTRCESGLEAVKK